MAARLQVMGLPVSREMLWQMELGKYSIRVSSFDAFFENCSIESKDD